MHHRNLKTITTTIATLALFSAGAAAQALPFEDELASCVTAINEHIDLAEASKVRHVVSRSDRESFGYKLSITTTVYGEMNDRKYTTVCFTRGSNAPSRLRINGRPSR